MLQKTQSGFYVLPRLAKVPKLIHGFSPKKFGNMSDQWGAAAARHRVQFAQAMGLDPASLVSVKQKHSQRIITIRQETPWRQVELIEADAMITKQKGIALLIKTADCLPLILVAAEKKAIGLVHSGKLGIQQGIHREALARLKAVFGINPAEILVGFGPAICPRCYHAKINLVKTVQIDLLKMGVKKENIELAEICTFENLDFYSHQRSVVRAEPEARFATILGWKN